MRLDLVVLASCFGVSEGAFAPGNPPPVRNNNPLDLRFYGQEGATESEDGKVFDKSGKKILPGFCKFTSKEAGAVAGMRQMCAWMQRGLSLAQMAEKWAPPSGPDGGNNTALYISEAVRRYEVATRKNDITGKPIVGSGDKLDPNVPLWNYCELIHIP